jgi:uncharacterized protein YneF (UPF0154 family)
MPDGFGLAVILIFVAVLLGIIYLIFKRRSKGILGNKLMIAGVVVVLLIVFMVIKGALIAYFDSIFKEAPYSYSEMRSIVFKYGVADSLVNQYNSATGEFDYLNKRDSLIKTHLYLTKSDLLYLHRKAAEVGFWNFPAREVKTDTTNSNGVKPTEYFIQFNYLHHSKTVVFSSNYDGPLQLADANRILIQEVETVISGAEERQRK